MKSYSVVLAPSAERQLAELYDYVADQSGLIRADGFVSRIIAECMSLSAFPERGMRRADIRPNLRIKTLARRVTIAYSTDDANTAIAILGIYYGGQEFAFLLRDTANDEEHDP